MSAVGKGQRQQSEVLCVSAFLCGIGKLSVVQFALLKQNWLNQRVNGTGGCQKVSSLTGWFLWACLWLLLYLPLVSALKVTTHLVGGGGGNLVQGTKCLNPAQFRGLPKKGWS